MNPMLLVQRPDGTTRRVPIEGARFRVGRSHQDNDLSFPEDASLSRWHLVIEREGEGWVVEDLKAKNTTLLNGVKVLGRRPIRPGDRIVAGKVVLMFDPRDDHSSGSVIFVPQEEEDGHKATLMTRLDGLLSGEVTTPGASSSTAGAAGRRLPIENPAVAALVRACQELPGLRPVPELFSLILDLSIDAVGAERGVVMSLAGSELVVRALRGEEFRISSTVRERVINERQSVLVRDTRADATFAMQQSIVAQHIRSMMAVPLQTKDRVIGLIHVDSRSLGNEFSQGDLELLTVLANIAAIRVEQERLAQIEVAQKLLARDLELAARIQRRLLPDVAPELAGFEVAGHNAPCRTVGGDYYDYFRYSDGKLGVVIGDVAGKGMPAALLMTSLKGGVQVMAEVQPDPAGLLERLNRVVCSNFPSNRFVSLFSCVLDPSSSQLSFCNGGHNPPLLVKEGGDVQRLRGGGAILGFDAASRFEARACPLARGDVLLLYSDGVTEATDTGGEEFGEDRLAQIAIDNPRASAAELLRLANEAVNVWSKGAPPADDITLVVVRRTA